jgi:hypothetical protein
VTDDELRSGLSSDHHEVRVWRAQDEWVVEWVDLEGVVVGQAAFRESEYGGFEWTRFWGARRGQGLYTQALRFSLEHGGALIRSDTGERDFYLSAGFVERDGWLQADARSGGKWLKGR